MTKRDLPSFEASDLKDYSESASVDRIWRRLETNLDRRDEAPVPRRWAWSLAVASAAFAIGMWVGRQSSAPVVEPTAELSAEPTQAAGRAPTNPIALAPIEPDSSLEQEEATANRAHPARTRRARLANPASAPADSAAGEGPVVALPPGSVEGSLEAPVPNLVAEPTMDAPAEPPKWQRLANGGEYEAALFDLAQAGGFESVLSASNAEQLMLLADIARATGQRQRAITALRRVVSRFPTDPVAPLAAWSLGRALEKAGDGEGASEAFAAYRSLSPEGDFAEDALVRQLKTAVQRREREVAQELAAQYSTDFPQGRRREEVARWVAMLATSADDPAVDAGVPEVVFPPLDDGEEFEE